MFRGCVVDPGQPPQGARREQHPALLHPQLYSGPSRSHSPSPAPRCSSRLGLHSWPRPQTWPQPQPLAPAPFSAPAPALSPAVAPASDSLPLSGGAENHMPTPSPGSGGGEGQSTVRSKGGMTPKSLGTTALALPIHKTAAVHKTVSGTGESAADQRENAVGELHAKSLSFRNLFI